MKMTNDAQLFVSIGGKLFLVTHVCNSIREANYHMETDKTTSFITEDEQGRYILAKSEPVLDFNKLQLTSPT
jgi:hypothetical protein